MKWQDGLDVAIREETARRVLSFLEEQRRALGRDPTGRDALEKLRRTPDAIRDAVLAFALFYRESVQASRSRTTPALSPAPTQIIDRPSAERDSPVRQAPPPVERPSPPAGPPAAPAPVDLRRTRDLWTRRIPPLVNPRLDGLLTLFAKCSLEDAPSKDGAWTLRALLHVFFELDWSAAADLLQEFAFRAGERICELILAQGEGNRTELMVQGCELLNANRQFAQHFECRALPERGGFDSTKCEEPEGQRTGSNDVTPLSFYIVRKQTGKPSRPARVKWA